ncbi:MAG TPA: hypothetical protein VGI60_14965 [Chthoniobacterales bacterium]|jgi:hypothetical protein
MPPTQIIGLLDELVLTGGFLGDHAALDQDADREVAKDKWRSDYSEQIIASAYAIACQIYCASKLSRLPKGPRPIHLSHCRPQCAIPPK